MSNNLSIKIFFILLLVCNSATSSSNSAFGHAEISAKETLSILKKQGTITSVKIIDVFDIAAINLIKAHKIIFRDVTFEKDIFLSQNECSIELAFHDCRFSNIQFNNKRWLYSLSFTGCEFFKPVIFVFNEFQGLTVFHNCTFMSKVHFKNCTFNDGSEFLNCSFHGYRSNFSNCHFKQPALFNDSIFHGKLIANFTIFQNDVSFVKCQMKNSAYFKNVIFKGDAEFRYCEMKEAFFGNFEFMTVFQNLADFRGCIMDSAIFEYGEFDGETSFVRARFGKGGVSFKDVVFKSGITSFDGIKSKGPIYFDGAYIPFIQFYWSEIGEAILKSNPDHKLLAYFYKKLRDLGQDSEAKEVYNHFRNIEMENKLRNSSIELSEKIWLLIEWFTWGLPTGYGTKSGRILFISFCCWILFSIPLFFKKGILVYLPDDSATKKIKNKKPLRRIYQPMHTHELPGNVISCFSFTKRIYIVLYFSFALLFKIRSNRIRYFEKEKKSERYAYEKYFLFLWFIGSILIALMGITSANNSPIIKQIIGELAF